MTGIWLSPAQVGELMTIINGIEYRHAVRLVHVLSTAQAARVASATLASGKCEGMDRDIPTDINNNAVLTRGG